LVLFAVGTGSLPRFFDPEQACTYLLADGARGRRVIAAVREIYGAHFKAVLSNGDTSGAACAAEDDEHVCLRKQARRSR
jgi:hypothetical protein